MVCRRMDKDENITIPAEITKQQKKTDGHYCTLRCQIGRSFPERPGFSNEAKIFSTTL